MMLTGLIGIFLTIGSLFNICTTRIHCLPLICLTELMWIWQKAFYNCGAAVKCRGSTPSIPFYDIIPQKHTVYAVTHTHTLGHSSLHIYTHISVYSIICLSSLRGLPIVFIRFWRIIKNIQLYLVNFNARAESISRARLHRACIEQVCRCLRKTRVKDDKSLDTDTLNTFLFLISPLTTV